MQELLRAFQNCVYFVLGVGGRGLEGDLFSLKDHSIPPPTSPKGHHKNCMSFRGCESIRGNIVLPALPSPQGPPQITVAKQMVLPSPSSPFRSPTVSSHPAMTPSPSA